MRGDEGRDRSEGSISTTSCIRSYVQSTVKPQACNLQPLLRALQIRVHAPDHEQESHPPRTSDAVLAGPDLEDLVADGRMVSIDQFTALAADGKLRSMLQSDAMQQAIRVIDSSSNRETALARALDNPQFSELCDQVLDHVSCNK